VAEPGSTNPRGPSARPIHDINDALLGTTNVSKKYIKVLNENKSVLTKITKKYVDMPKAFASAITKAQAKTHRTSVMAAANIGAANATMGNFFSKKQWVPFTNSISPMNAAIIKATGGGESFLKVMDFIAPSLSKAATTGDNAARNMAAMGVAGLALAALWKIFQGAFKGTFDSMKIMNRSLGVFNVGWRESAQFASSAAMAQAFYNVKTEDFGSVMNSLTSTYGVNAGKIAELRGQGRAWAGELADSVGQFLGATKIMGMTTDEAGRLASTLVMLHKDVTQLPAAFADFRNMVEETQMAPAALQDALSQIAPVSLTSATALNYTIGAFRTMNKTIRESRDEALKFAVSGGGAKIIQDVQQAFTKAAAGLSLPEMMAFGGGQEPGMNPMDAIKKMVSTRMSRPEMLVNYFKKVSDSAAAGQKDTAIFMAATQKGFSPEAAYAAIDSINMLTREGSRRELTGKAKLDAQKAAIDKMAIASEGLADPMEKLVSIATSIMTAMFATLNIFRPGAGTSLAASINQAAPATKPMREAAAP
jgi:hypothetical protein